MKAKDIKPGVVYGYRRGKYGSVTPVVFLAPIDKDHLYATTSHHRKPDTPAYVKARSGSKPGRGSFYSSPTVGYPVVLGGTTTKPGSLPSVTLADFEAATSNYLGDGISYGVITTLGHVAGLYEDVKADEAAERDAARAQRDAEERQRQDAAQRVARVLPRFASLGVVVRADNEWDPTGLVIDLDNADKLLALLSASPDSPKED
ncbi:hypothetical protein ABGB18_11100 [Nonomuraea sp. B12E4]|uniref:hypothetical protein n=1 Tax=Nonomuraea sp. B12E4 TaxID=3153564 RepID=UPI00325DD4B1